MSHYLYTPTGYRRVSTLPPFPVRLFPWTTSRRVRIGGRPAFRHELEVTAELVPCMAPGVGGLRRRDIGRVLVVDVYDDGTVIDVLE
jgi:hypothetical protein